MSRRTRGLTHFTLPAEQLQSAASLFASLGTGDTGVFRFHYWCFSITSLLAMALVVGIRPERTDPGLFLRAARVWALLAFAVSSVDFLYVQQRALTIARSWPDLDRGSRAALLALGTGRLDATWFIGFAALAPWPVALAQTARRCQTWSRGVQIAAYLVALDALCVSLGAATRQMLFVAVAAAGAIVVTPVFFFMVSYQYSTRSR